jgi:hypothetical protein
MADDFQPLPVSEPEPPQISYRNILVWMAVVIVAETIAGTVFASAKFGLAVLVGGGMSFVNFIWQRNSTRSIFDGAIHGEMPVMPALRYFLRYAVIGAVLWGIYLTELLPIAAVILGLAAFAIAVVFEGLKGIFVGPNTQGP